jgi:hypothetical protein
MSEEKDYWGFEGKGYVTEYGNYGQDIVMVFDRDKLTERQWDELSMQTDKDRIVYVSKILKGWDVSNMES